MADVTRIEKYLAFLNGERDDYPMWVTRIEHYLYDLCEKGGGGGGGSTDYNALHNKPQINGETLTGNKTAADLHLLDENSNLTNEQMNDLLAIIG